MRILFTFVFIFLFNLPMILGQCSGKLIFLTQNDLNEFFTNNSCEHLDTVRIGPNSSDSFDCDITSLTPILGVRKINNLSFGSNCPLENLNGLDSVQSLGVVDFDKLRHLTDLSGIASVDSIYKLKFVAYGPFSNLNSFDNLVFLNQLWMTGYDQVLFNWSTSPLSKFNEIHPTIRLFNIQSEDDLASLIPLSLDTIDQLNVRLSNIDISSFENVKHFNKLILGTYKPGEYLNVTNEIEISSVDDLSIEGLSKANWSKLNFQSVLKVDELDLKRMDSLESLSELLPNLEAINSAIGLFGNRHLNDISLIDDFDIPIGNDNLYTTYSNDPNGDSFDIYKDLKIAIIDNEILSNCNSDFLCKAMMEYPLLIEINENKPSCLKETIINDCNLSNTTELFKKSATVWPNPSNGIIHLSSDQDVDLIRVIDCNGNIVKESSFNSTIDISEFEDGIYFLQLFYGLTYKSIKFIKQ